jgi:hypothetical protein
MKRSGCYFDFGVFNRGLCARFDQRRTMIKQIYPNSHTNTDKRVSLPVLRVKAQQTHTRMHTVGVCVDIPHWQPPTLDRPATPNPLCSPLPACSIVKAATNCYYLAAFQFAHLPFRM